MRHRKHLLILSPLLLLLCLSFSATDVPQERVTQYYDHEADKLLRAAKKLQTAAAGNTNTEALKVLFLNCRNEYKAIELFVDVFDPYKALVLNGPDLLKIEEENPGDSIKPHGLQVIEGILYAPAPDKKRLVQETSLLTQQVKQLRNDPDRIYYFKDEKIWEAMRLGVYRIISLGITGFDVPLSYHALPETKRVLMAVQAVTACYKQRIPAAMYKEVEALTKAAFAYLAAHTDFNTFDRLTFVREHIDPLSAWLAKCSAQMGYINYQQRVPLNPVAKDLFASDIFDLNFFSPNSQYRMTPERVALGKRLFYDARLSGNGERSCASCHKPELAFTDGLAKPARLTGGKVLPRNTPTLLNCALQTRQFYDSRTETLENQLSAVVHNTDEMNGSLRNSIAWLSGDKEYAPLFAGAYAESKEHVTEYNIANAICSYVRSLSSLNSRFDRYMRRQTDSMSKDEKNGFNLFMGKAKCGTCHYAPLFNGLTPPVYHETESEALGVPETDAKRSTLDADNGKYNYTRVTLHKHFFKTPTVRNAALTAPYMHNGVFATLDKVLEFYNDGGGAGRGAELPTQTLPTEKLHLSRKEMKDIIAFLHTLTDNSKGQ